MDEKYPIFMGPGPSLRKKYITALHAACFWFPTQPAAIKEMFAPVGGGKDQACRGKDSSDNSESYYTLVTANSLDECREKCFSDLI